MNNVQLILIRGLPGSGKSTLAKVMSSCTDIPHFEADMYFIDKATGIYNFNASQLSDAHRICLYRTRQCIENGRGAIVANTFTRLCELRPYLDLADQYINVKVSIIECKGTWQNIHAVPEEAIERMRKRWEEVL